MHKSTALHPYAVYHAIDVIAMYFPDPQIGRRIAISIIGTLLTCTRP